MWRERGASINGTQPSSRPDQHHVAAAGLAADPPTDLELGEPGQRLLE